jgi:hypothetical protein
MEAAFALPQAMAYINNLLTFLDAEVQARKYPTGYLSLRTCGRTAALLGMQQFGRENGPVNQSTGTVEMALLNTGTGVDTIRIAEIMALGQGGLLHWGQSNGFLVAQQVQQGYPRLATWQAMQRILGGKTFTNLFMKRCGLV